MRVRLEVPERVNIVALFPLDSGRTAVVAIDGDWSTRDVETIMEHLRTVVKAAVKGPTAYQPAGKLCKCGGRMVGGVCILCRKGES